MRPNYHNRQLVEFHSAFGHPVNWTPTLVSADVRKLRIKLILEEAIEFAEAAGFDVSLTTDADGKTAWRLTERTDPPSLVGMADGLADLRYVTEGAAVALGIPLERCFREVHRSNMSKLGEDGKPIYREDGKILKGPNFQLPRLDLVLDLFKEAP